METETKSAKIEQDSLETEMETNNVNGNTNGNDNASFQDQVETEMETFKDLTFSFPPSEMHILPLRKREWKQKLK